MKRIEPLVLTLVAMLCVGGFANAGEPFGINVTSDGIDVSERGTKVLHYQLATKSLDGEYPRSNYIHPLYDLDGNVLTEDFPDDHKWHRGIFWAWHQVLIGDKHIGDPWICERFQWEVIDTQSNMNDDGTCDLQVKVHWKSPDWQSNGQLVPFTEESVTMRIHPAAENRRVIDFEIRLLALVPELQIGGSDNAKGYGGFSLRIKNPLELQFRGKSGSVQAQIGAVDAGKWLEISNQDDSRHNRVIVLTHKTHPIFPALWILRNHGKAMQNVVYPGRHAKPVSDDPAKPLSLRYRLVIHRGDMDAKAIEAWQTEYESIP